MCQAPNGVKNYKIPQGADVASKEGGDHTDRDPRGHGKKQENAFHTPASSGIRPAKTRLPQPAAENVSADGKKKRHTNQDSALTSL